MSVYWIDPAADPRWPEFVERHPNASIFHTTGWLEALRRTYGFQPVALTTSPPESPLTNGIVFCRVSSWLTGRRLLSLPFSDHCDPLVDARETCAELLQELHHCLARERHDYFEIRAQESSLFDAVGTSSLQKARSYYLHRLDLRLPLDKLIAGFHKDCVQRKVRRAEREALQIKCGRSEPFLREFYRLQKMTRRRQGIPPQPMTWFRNLADCLGDKLLIRIAARDGVSVAAILTLSHKETCVFKYGCSDAEYNALGGTQLLLWEAIKESKEKGMKVFDMGRSDLDDSGLVTFKDRWGATKSDLIYRRGYRSLRSKTMAWPRKLAYNPALHLPLRLLPSIGTLLYRHFA